MTWHVGVQTLPWIGVVFFALAGLYWRGRALRSEERSRHVEARLRNFGLSEED